MFLCFFYLQINACTIYDQQNIIATYWQQLWWYFETFELFWSVHNLTHFKNMYTICSTGLVFM